MLTLLRSLSVRQLLGQQLPAISLALLIAEMFYKFHSFTLECLAFLATWALAEGLFTGVRWLLASRTAPAAGASKQQR